jgi:hypothetical protein
VPDVEVHRPERERDERIGKETQRIEVLEDRTEDRSREPREQSKRGQIPEQHVLSHVEAEQLLAECMDRGDERGEQRQDP